ncbi:MAG: hypothetical protein ACOYB3_01375 [Azonexus sp.]
MTAKTLRNPALRTKFNVGDTVKLPTEVWQHFVSPMRMARPKLPQVHGVVKEVSDRIIMNKKPNGNGVNRHCRFSVVMDSPQLGEVVVWDEWMLERLVIMFYAEKPKETAVCSACGQAVPGK